jgi:hypothetical protein
VAVRLALGDALAVRVALAAVADGLPEVEGVAEGAPLRAPLSEAAGVKEELPVRTEEGEGLGDAEALRLAAGEEEPLPLRCALEVALGDAVAVRVVDAEAEGGCAAPEAAQKRRSAVSNINNN